MTPDEFPSKNRINKAGKYLRDLVNGTITPKDFDRERFNEAIAIVTMFREAHGYPMTKVRNGLTSMRNTEGLDVPITQRHKRVPRIVRKLVRMGDTSLARLEDVGGCRVVVNNPSEMDRLTRRIRKNWHADFTRDPRDYVANPKDIGYRAQHFIVRRDGRAIEVQVRTVGQQAWADAVEAIDARLRLNLKDGIGDPDLIEYFAAAGELIYCTEYGVEIDDVLRSRMAAARLAVVEKGFYSE